MSRYIDADELHKQGWMFVVIGIKRDGEEEVYRTDKYSEAVERVLITPLEETYIGYRIDWEKEDRLNREDKE
jgi:hypothetical protein